MLQNYALPMLGGAAAGYAMTSAKTKKVRGALYGAAGGALAYMVASFVRSAMGMQPLTGIGAYAMQGGAGAVGALSLLHFIKP